MAETCGKSSSFAEPKIGGGSATKIDIRGALYGERPSPSDEIWLRDSDIVVVPKMPIRRTDDLIELYLSRGVYSFPIGFGYSLNGTSSVGVSVR